MKYFFAAFFAVICASKVACDDAPSEDDAQFHNDKAKERVHLLHHLADRMDLDGEALRHIRKHLLEVAGTNFDTSDIQDIEGGNNAKGIFYFFKLHDFDNNQKLDGLELMAALTDYHKDEGEKGQFKEGGETFLENEAETIVDELLLKHDKNEDGFIDFFEVMNRDAMSLMNELAQADVNAEQQQQSSMEQELQQQQQQQQSSLEQELQDQQQQHDGENQGETHDESDPNQEQQQVNQQGQENQDITQQGESSEQQQDQQQQQQEQQEPSSLEQEYEQKQGQEG